MITFLSIAALILALSLVLGLVRVFIGPAIEDRMLSLQLVGTSGVGLVLLLGVILDLAASLDLALVLALLAAVSVVALTRQERKLESTHD
jgi:multicomponent Na+:H+ antiporter subunit F